MKSFFESVVKARTNIEIERMFRRIEAEERLRSEEASFELMRHYLKVAERAIAEAKKAKTYKDGLYWLGLTKRYVIRFFKVKKLLENGS